MDFVRTYFEKRKHKGLNAEQAAEALEQLRGMRARLRKDRPRHEREHPHEPSIATDLGVVSHPVRHRIGMADCVVLEFNHDERMLRDGDYPWFLKQRIEQHAIEPDDGQLAFLERMMRTYPVMARDVLDGTQAQLIEPTVEGWTPAPLTHLVVAPGFIDCHSHGDQTMLAGAEAMKGSHKKLAAKLAELEIMRRKDLQSEQEDPEKINKIEQHFEIDRGRIESALESAIARVKEKS